MTFVSKRQTAAAVLLLVFFSLTSSSIIPLRAEGEPNFTVRENSSDSSKSDSPKNTESEPKKSDDSKKPFSEVVPDATPIPGLIPMFRKKENLYAEIGPAQLNVDYIIVISIAKGIGSDALYTGQSWDIGEDMLWQFCKVDDRIQIVRRNYRYTADSGTTEEKAVQIGFADSVIFSLPIIAAGPAGGDIVDLTSIFMSDLPGIGRKALPGCSFAKDRSSWAKIKGKNDQLTDNMEIEVAATYSGSSASSSPLIIDPRGVTVNVHYSISKLPTSGYTPRLADERVGYFTTTVKNFNKNPDDSNFVRYINRWNLQKLETGAETSLPKKPIVFWLEKTIPYQYRKPIRDGILEWNKAFEEAGFYNAVEVRQQEDNDTWDPEDINYNTIRWSTASMGFAIGPSRVNPLTGEILDADVVLDVGFINNWNQEFELYSPETLAEQFCGQPLTARKLSRKNPEASAVDLAGMETAGAHSERAVFINDRLMQSQQMGLAGTFFEVMIADAEGEAQNTEEPAPAEAAKEKTAAEEPKENSEEKPAEEKPADPKPEESTPEEPKPEESPSEEEKAAPSPEETAKAQQEKKEHYESERTKLIRQGLSRLTTHEIGHTLGLRHNFRLSTLHSLDEINNPDPMDKYGYSGSVMEYLPANIMPKGEKQGDYYPTRLGEYDYWVIRYGYSVLNNSTDGDKEKLLEIAADQSNPAHRYAEDYDCYLNSDPLINTFDLGSDPLAYYQLRVRLVKEILPGLNGRIVQKGESYTKLRSRFMALGMEYLDAMSNTARYIGGIHINRDYKGDENARQPFVPVAAAKQREALRFIVSDLFSSEPLKLTPDLTNYLMPKRWTDWSSQTTDSYDLDLHQLILTMQKYVLFRLFDPQTLSRIADTQFHLPEGEDVLSLEELFQNITDAVFSELGSLDGEYSPQKPAISSLHRNLQREYFNLLAAMALQKSYGWDQPIMILLSADSGSGSVNDNASLARLQLQVLKGKIDAVLNENRPLDSATKAHLADLSVRAGNTLNASVRRDY